MNLLLPITVYISLIHFCIARKERAQDRRSVLGAATYYAALGFLTLFGQNVIAQFAKTLVYDNEMSVIRATMGVFAGVNGGFLLSGDTCCRLVIVAVGFFVVKVIVQLCRKSLTGGKKETNVNKTIGAVLATAQTQYSLPYSLCSVKLNS